MGWWIMVLLWIKELRAIKSFLFFRFYFDKHFGNFIGLVIIIDRRLQLYILSDGGWTHLVRPFECTWISCLLIRVSYCVMSFTVDIDSWLNIQRHCSEQALLTYCYFVH